MPRPAKTKISVVIPVYNALPELKSCLHSLESTAKGLYELILVDNGSGPATRGFIAGLKGAVKIRNKANAGFSKAVNLGLRAACGDYIAVVNSDVAFYPGGLQGLAACLDACPDAGACGPLTNRTVGVQRVVLDLKLEGDRKALEPFAAAMGLKFAGEYFDVHRLVASASCSAARLTRASACWTSGSAPAASRISTIACACARPAGS